jgi:hypothetical protein
MTFTGPPYPPGPAPGSNQIGEFQIGVSPVGTIAPFDPWQTVIIQYANSPILDGLITSFNAAIDQTLNFDNFFDLQWNIDTAIGYGLDVIGRIVGVTRTLSISGGIAYFGFQEAGALGFGQAPFFSGEPVTTSFNLSDTSFRTVLNAKMLANISDGSIPSINAILLALFPGRGNCYVIDNQNMTMIYRFNFVLTQIDLAIIEQAGLLPTPCGVISSVSEL